MKVLRREDDGTEILAEAQVGPRSRLCLARFRRSRSERWHFAVYRNGGFGPKAIETFEQVDQARAVFRRRLFTN